MSKTDTWIRLGDITKRAAARLRSLRDEIQKGDSAPSTQTAAEVTAPSAAGEEGGAPVGRSGDPGAPSKPPWARGLLFSIEKVGGCIPAQADLGAAVGAAPEYQGV